MIKKIASVLLILFLISCSTTAVAVPTLEKSTPTFAPVPSSTFQPMETAIPSPTSSQVTPSASVGDDSCMKNARTQLEMNQCAGDGYRAAYEKLNELIAELKSHMDASQYQVLLEIESDWETAIEKHCSWQSNFFEGGSIQPMIYALCLNQEYWKRIEALRLNLCEGNGMTGECEESLKYKQ